MGGRRSRPRYIQKRRRPESLRVLLADLPRTECDRPDKEVYRSEKKAETAAERQWREHRRILRPYTCGDHWHLTKHPYIEGGRPFHVDADPT